MTLSELIQYLKEAGGCVFHRGGIKRVEFQNLVLAFEVAVEQRKYRAGFAYEGDIELINNSNNEDDVVLLKVLTNGVDRNEASQ